jgi:hypothetical protein
MVAAIMNKLLTRLFNEGNRTLAGIYVQCDLGQAAYGQTPSTGDIFVQAFYTDGSVEFEPFGRDIHGANVRALDCVESPGMPTLKMYRNDPVLALSPFRLTGAFVDGTNCLVRFRDTQNVMCVRQNSEREAVALARRLGMK